MNVFNHMFDYKQPILVLTRIPTLSCFLFGNELIFQFLSLSLFGLSVCLSLRGLLCTVPPFSRPLLLNIAMEILVKKGKNDDESIHSFFSRRLGKEVIFLIIVLCNCETSIYTRQQSQFYIIYLITFIIVLSILSCDHFSSSVCLAGRHSCGQFVSRCVCGGLQEVECALLFSSFLQCRTAERFIGLGYAAGLRYAATFTLLLLCADS